jgi:hypothetical protein
LTGLFIALCRLYGSCRCSNLGFAWGRN